MCAFNKCVRVRRIKAEMVIEGGKWEVRVDKMEGEMVPRQRIWFM